MGKSKDRDDHKYLSYCIPAGLLLGTVIAVVGSFNIGMSVGIGTLSGVVIGTIMDYDTKKSLNE